MKKIFSILLGVLMFIALVSCGLGGVDRDNDGEHTVTVICSEGVSVISKNPVKVKDGAKAVFTLSYDDSTAIQSVSYGNFNYSTKTLTISSVSEDLRVQVVGERVAFDTSLVYPYSFVGTSADASSRRDGEYSLGVRITVSAGLQNRAFVGRPVVNFGLYAAIGTKAMLDLSLAGVGEGDVVVIAPELDEQTLSMYFSSEHIFPAIDENYLMAAYLRGNSNLSLLGGAFSFAQRKLSYKSNIPDPDGIYNVKSFNEHGDIKKGLRDANIMQFYYDPAKMISFSEDIFDSEFIEYLNEYVDICERRGALVYFSYCPINLSAIANDSFENRRLIENYLEDNLKCEVISKIDDYIYDRAYFYDTNFHLNDTGVELRTKKLAQDLLVALENFTLIDTEVTPPPLPEADTRYYGEFDENSLDFTFEKMPNGAYMITGLSEAGRAKTKLTIPLGYDGYKVTAIGERAFEGSQVKEVTVSENSNLRNFFNDSFRGSSVTDLYLYYDFTNDEDKLTPASDFFGLRIHISSDSAYQHNYDWLESSKGYVFVVDIEK